MENSVDPAHLQILHQDAMGRRKRPINSTRGYTDDVQSFEFYKVPYGIMKKRTYVNGFSDEHPLVFPNVLRTQNGTEIRVPVDNYKTIIFQVDFDQTEDGSLVDEGPELTIKDPGPYKDPPDKLYPFTKLFMDTIPQQDQGIWETQGQIVDRTIEHLSYSDRGVVLFRRLVIEQQELVAAGGDPMGVERDPDHAMIDTNLQTVLDRMKTGTYGPTGINTPTYEVEPAK
jgi:5,5'-dehydrodivanillate O-demethylase